MKTAWMVLVCGACVSAAQDSKDEKKDGSAPIREEAVKALRATAQAGAFEFAGSTRLEAEGAGETIEAALTGAVDRPFRAAVAAKSGRCVYEVFHKDGKTAERMTWRGTPMAPGESANEILSLLDLEKMATAVEKSRSGKAGKNEKLSGSMGIPEDSDARKAAHEPISRPTNP